MASNGLLQFPIASSYDALWQLPSIASLQAKDIATLPVVRDLEIRLSNRTANSPLKIDYKEQVEGLLGQIRGWDSSGDPCERCRNEKGALARCVTVPGFFKGACCNCQYAMRGRNCSKRDNSEGPRCRTDKLFKARTTLAAIPATITPALTTRSPNKPRATTTVSKPGRNSRVEQYSRMDDAALRKEELRLKSQLRAVDKARELKAQRKALENRGDGNGETKSEDRMLADSGIGIDVEAGEETDPEEGYVDSAGNWIRTGSNGLVS